MKNPTQKEIEARNKKFKNATLSEKRVLIAKDVISQINSGKIKPKNNAWVEFFGVDTTQEEDSIQEQLLKPETTCNACALGGMFISCTLFNNNEKFGDYSWNDIGSIIEYGGTFGNKLNKIFTDRQLQLIEIAFERGNGYDWSHTPFSETQLDKAIRFCKSLPARSSLIKIMNNIIKNKGIFKP